MTLSAIAVSVWSLIYIVLVLAFAPYQDPWGWGMTMCVAHFSSTLYAACRLAHPHQSGFCGCAASRTGPNGTEEMGPYEAHYWSLLVVLVGPGILASLPLVLVPQQILEWPLIYFITWLAHLCLLILPIVVLFFYALVAILSALYMTERSNELQEHMLIPSSSHLSLNRIVLT